MKSFREFFAVLMFGLLMAAMVPAQAGVMSFNFASNGTHNVSGILTFNDTPNSIWNGTSFGYDITNILGVVSGVGGGIVSSLITNPSQPNPYVSSGYVIDNVLFPTQPFYDSNGVFFMTANGSIWNLWVNGTYDAELHSYMAGVDEHGILSAQAIQQDHSVPEPQSLALLGIGLIGMTFLRRQSKAVPAKVATA